jgi:hypothetical protein
VTTAESIWYLDKNGGLARVDVSGIDRWTMPRDLHESLPALLAFGARRQFDVGHVTDAFQTGPNELVLRLTAARWFSEFSRSSIERAVRLDVTTGAVVEYPAAFGATSMIGGSMVGFYVDGWRRYRIFNSEAWDVLNTVTGEFIARHQWTESVFRLPGGGTVGLPVGGSTLGVVDGRLYVGLAGSLWSYRIFDLDNLVTDGADHGGREPLFPIPDGMTRLWSMTTDPDSWYARQPGGEFSREMLQAINTTALETGGGGAAELLAVMNAESGLRTNAYHPAGRYGLLQMSADELGAAGWDDTEDEFLAAGERQIPVIRTHLAGLGIPHETDETGLWLCLLLPADERIGVELETVIAAPNGPRPQLWATHGVADVGGDGRLTVDDLRRYLRSKRRDPRLVELLKRTQELAAVIPDWPNLTEVNEGDDMAIVRPSAAQLGLTVEIIALQQEPGFDHEQVVSIDPPPGRLAPLTEPVRVTVNFEG